MDKRIKEFIKSIVRINDSSARLSRGIAIGFFFGLSIFWGLQIVLALVFAQLLNGNRKTAVIMTAISNPFTTPFIYPLSYKIGHFIINDPERSVDYSSLVSVKDVLNLGLPFLEAILAGTTVAGLAGGIVLYIASKKYLEKRKKTSN
ncbi:MAG TPA: DUF2062 domain-containing protein [Spirochaetota bacterium]|nr:DUF2062 domain-containing protein [Spirochaetota bacterium]HPS88220.1 DUF2062 domain-containing protein [Spirochaetota bacterium]